MECTMRRHDEGIAGVSSLLLPHLGPELNLVGFCRCTEYVTVSLIWGSCSGGSRVPPLDGGMAQTGPTLWPSSTSSFLARARLCGKGLAWSPRSVGSRVSGLALRV